MISFTKLHGIGNDFVLIDTDATGSRDWASLARAMCDRHFGVGADGLLLMSEAPEGAFRMVMLNPDGTDGDMCGNGVRCVARWLGDQGRFEDSFRLWVGERLLHVARVGDQFRVDMGAAHVLAEPLIAEGMRGRCVCVGNPHFAAQVECVGDVPLAEVGPKIEHHPFFENRTNVHVYEVAGMNHLRGKTWERGAGLTLACGSGACAIAAAGYAEGLVGSQVRVSLPGGDLEIELDGAGHAHMTGPAAASFLGEWLGGS